MDLRDTETAVGPRAALRALSTDMETQCCGFVLTEFRCWRCLIFGTLEHLNQTELYGVFEGKMTDDKQLIRQLLNVSVGFVRFFFFFFWDSWYLCTDEILSNWSLNTAMLTSQALFGWITFRRSMQHADWTEKASLRMLQPPLGHLSQAGYTFHYRP